MKKLAIVAILLLAICSLASSQAKPGGIAREIAMGGSQAGTSLILNPFMMDDPALLLLNPAYQIQYKDYAWMNIAGGGLTGLTSSSNIYGKQNAGVAFGLNSDWALGVTLSYDPSAINAVNTLMGPVPSPWGTVPSIESGRRASGAQSIPSVANVWEIVAANHLSSLDWGIGVMYGWSNSDSKVDNVSGSASNTEASSHVWGFRGGINLPFGTGNSLDVSAALRLDKATDKIDLTPTVNNADGAYSASGTEFQVNARAKLNVSSKFNFVPYGSLITISANPQEDTRPTGVTTAPVTINYNVFAYAVGVGGEYRTSAFYFAGGLSLQSARLKLEFTPPGSALQTYTFTYSAIPVANLGGEWWFTDWLAGRAGYYRSIGNINNKTETSTLTAETNLSVPNSMIFIGDVPTTADQGLVTLGIGLKFGGWALDGTVSEEALRRGLGLVGANDNINTFGYLTASYYFGE